MKDKEILKTHADDTQANSDNYHDPLAEHPCGTSCPMNNEEYNSDNFFEY